MISKISSQECREAVFTIRQWLKENPQIMNVPVSDWSNVTEAELTRIFLMKIGVYAGNEEEQLNEEVVHATAN